MTRSRRYIAIFVFFVVIAIFPQTIFATKKICEECTAADACTGSLKCVDNNGKLVGGATKGTCGDLCPAGTICFRNPACVSTFSELINKIANFIFWVGLGLAPLMILVGAVYIFTAAGDPAKVKTAMNIFLYTGIGLVIIITAKALAAVITGIFK